MKNKWYRAIAASLFCFVVFSGARTSEAASFEEIYMTNASGSYERVEVFDWNETPWLYLRTPDVRKGNSTFINYFSWYDPDSNLVYKDKADPNRSNERWFRIDDWDSVKKVGTWDVDASYFNPGSIKGSGSTSFTVTPEPVSSVLFLLGGLSLFGFEYKKRKKLNS